MNLTLAFKVVQVAMITLTVVNRVLIIVENLQNEKVAKDGDDVPGTAQSPRHPLRRNSGT